jgi:hypothetical protein
LFNHLNKEFAKPVRHTDETHEYLPTQFFAEWAKDHGYDGLRYKSAMSQGGQNVVFFDTAAVAIKSVRPGLKAMSNSEVASSKIKIGESLRMARAMAMRYLWPPLSLVPRSPITVLYPRGSLSFLSHFCFDLPKRHEARYVNEQQCVCQAVSVTMS